MTEEKKRTSHRSILSDCSETKTYSKLDAILMKNGPRYSSARPSETKRQPKSGCETPCNNLLLESKDETSSFQCSMNKCFLQIGVKVRKAGGVVKITIGSARDKRVKGKVIATLPFEGVCHRIFYPRLICNTCSEHPISCLNRAHTTVSLPRSKVIES